MRTYTSAAVLLGIAVCVLFAPQARAQTRQRDPTAAAAAAAKSRHAHPGRSRGELNEGNHTLRHYCSKRYGHRKYLFRRKEVPPVLWTFPGSGNTWTRLVIEFATSKYTGSVYDDRSLRAALPGEIRCDRSVVMIKVRCLMQTTAAKTFCTL